MFRMFYFLQSDMVFRIINRFSRILKAVAIEKKLHDFNAFPDSMQLTSGQYSFFLLYSLAC